MVRRLDEFALIDRLTNQGEKNLALHSEIEVGIGDDAAVVQNQSDQSTVLSCDTMVENIHFNSWTMQPEDIGYKLMAANVSDIMAMGAQPKYALVAVSMPKRYSQSKLQSIYKGLYTCAEEYGVSIIGGDTTSSPRHLTLTVTITGTIQQHSALLRSSAKTGDSVFITGELGQSAAGLHHLLETKQKGRSLSLAHFPEDLRPLIGAHRRPQPKQMAADILVSTGCHALNDVSDGLASEVHEIARASTHSILLYEESIPVTIALQAYGRQVQINPLDWILYGGEDFQLVGTAPMSKIAHIRERFVDANLPFYEIGEVQTRQKDPQVHLLNKLGEQVELTPNGYRHF